MWKISDGPQRTNTEADKLAREIKCLLRDCENDLQATMNMDPWRPGRSIGAAGEFALSFVVRAICVCNADGSVSTEEAALFCDVVAEVAPQWNLMRRDLQRVCALLREQYAGSRKELENWPSGHVWNVLERNDAVNGTANASRYRELVLRMANMLASAEGVRSEQKLSCVAEIERAISPLFAEAACALAHDIDALVRDCVNPLLGHFKGHLEKDNAAELLKMEFWCLSVAVCNADGRVSEEEAALHHEIFIHLTPDKAARHCFLL